MSIPFILRHYLVLVKKYQMVGCYGSLCAAVCFCFRSGGALMTCLSSFLKRRYSRVFVMRFSSSTLSLGFGSDITPPPDWSEYSKSDASRRPNRELYRSALGLYRGVRCSGTIVRQGI